MSFPDAVKKCFAHFANFSGRASRSEYWYFALFVVLASIVASILDSVLFPYGMMSPLNLIVNLVTVVPFLAVAARRLHDIDRSGWWQLLAFIPVLGWIVLIVWFVQKSDVGSNRFGPPATASAATAFAAS